MIRVIKDKWNILVPLFLLVSVLVVYIHNLSSSVYGGDVGDFISAIAVKGVPHAPGYPLFTLLGIIFNSFPINASPAFKVGLISVLFSSFSVCLVYFLILRITKKLSLAIFTSILLAFYYLFWLYAEIAEVFALNNFLALLIFYITLLYYESKKVKYFYFLSFLVGLSLTHHHTIILTFPSILVLLIAANRKLFLNWRLIIKGIVLFLLGFSVYIYVPIAASQNPPINWDNASSLKNFIRLVLRIDYGTFTSSAHGLSLTANTYERFLEVKHYFVHLFVNTTPIGFLMGILGMFYLYKNKRILFISLLLTFLISGPLFVAYAAFPLSGYFNIGMSERFHLLSSVFYILFIPFGIMFFISYLETFLKKIIPQFRMKAIYKNSILFLFFIIPFSLFRFNYPKTDLSKVWIGDILAQDMMYILPKNSVLLVAGDTSLFNTWYIKYALKKRTDIETINTSGLWGSNFFINKREEYLRKTKKDISGNELAFEVIKYIASERPLFSTSKIKESPNWVPYGLLFHFVSLDDVLPSKEEFLKEQDAVWSKLHVPYSRDLASLAYRNLTIVVIPSFYSQSMANVGDYLVSKYGDVDKASEYFKKSIEINPSDKYGYAGMGYVYLSKGKCKEAESMFQYVLGIDPTSKNAAILLYATYASCFKDQIKANAVASAFQSKFGTSISKQLNELLKEKEN